MQNKITKSLVLAFCINACYAGSISFDGIEAVSSSGSIPDRYWYEVDGIRYLSRPNDHQKAWQEIKVLEAGNVTEGNGKTSTLLAKKIILSGKGNTMSLVSTAGDNSIINIGLSDAYVNDLEIRGRGTQSGEGVIVSGHGNFVKNDQINIFADYANLSLTDPQEGLAYPTDVVLASGYTSIDSGINVHVNKRLEINGHIANGFLTHFVGYENRFAISQGFSISINADEQKLADVIINGDIYSGNLDDYDGNLTNIIFKTANSIFTGKVEDHYNYQAGFATAIEKAGTQGTHLYFDNSARWNMTSDSLVTDLKLNNGATVNLVYGRSSEDAYRTLEIINLYGRGGVSSISD